MGEIYYKKKKRLNNKKILKGLSAVLFLAGIGISLYVFSPLILWQIYSAPTLQSIEAPIPRNKIVNTSVIGSLIASAKNSLGVDYTDAQNWFPGYKAQVNAPKLSSYTISIPAIKIKDALVSTTDYDLSKHLVNYQGTSTPPDIGNSVVFGHSTLPQLFNPADYKTIFANAQNIKVGDEIFAIVNGVTYKYKVFNIFIVDADDTSLFTQSYDNSYLTLVTCTPPGTTWKRLVIKTRLEKI